MGAIVNAVAILVAGVLGSLLKVGIPQRVQSNIMQAVALGILAIGIEGIIGGGGNTLALIICLVIGSAIGSIFDIDAKINNLLAKLEEKLNKKGTGEGNFRQGLVSGTMLFCIGSMAIMGSLESGLNNDHSILYTKSVMDGISAFIMASSMGVGVAASSIPVLILQGGLTILATYLAPIFSEVVVINMSYVGSVLLLALGLNMLELTDLKVMNYVPAIFIPLLIGRWL